MTLHEAILAEYPELQGTKTFADGIILLQDDSDGLGVYIAEWNYDKPLPKGMKIGK